MTFRPAFTVSRAALRGFAPLPRPETLVERWEAFRDEGGSVRTTLLALKVACEVGDERAADAFVRVLGGLGLSEFLHVFGVAATWVGWDALPFFHRTLARCHTPMPDRPLLEVSVRIVTFATVPAFDVAGGRGGPAAVTRAVDDLWRVLAVCPTLAPFLFDTLTVLGRPTSADALARCYALVKRFGPPPEPPTPAAEA